MADKGWIKIDRGIQEHWLWQNAEYLKAWLDLIMLANYEDKKMPYKGEIITCKRGDVNMSIKALATRWGWTWRTTKNYLKLLENDNMIVLSCTTNRTVISLVNYRKFQDYVERSAQRIAQRSKSEVHSEVHITKKDKKDKEGKEIYMPPADDDEGMSPAEWDEKFQKGEIKFE